MKIALAQINTTVGDLAGNEAKILDAYRRGVAAGVELVVFPELAITGYPPRDLLSKSRFIPENLDVLDRLAAATGATGMLVGYVGRNETRPGRDATNSVALLQHGQIAATRAKTLLPTYDVFDEDRYFEPAQRKCAGRIQRRKNRPDHLRGCLERRGFLATNGVTAAIPRANWPQAGAQILFNISASPWHLGKNETRCEMLSSMAAKTGCPLVYCNSIGGNDELVFDGASLVFNGRAG